MLYLKAKELEDLSIGGQAVIEGVMMRSRKHWSMAVRRPDGSVYCHSSPIDSFTTRHPVWNYPFLRGISLLVETLILGFKALGQSTQIALGEASPDYGKKGGGWRESKGSSGMGVEFIISLFIALIIFIALFIALPTYLAPRVLGNNANVIYLNLLEGFLRIVIFILYLLITSLLKDIRRLYQYHGAEHQAIHLLEEGLPLEPQLALRKGTDHLRCGTSLLLLVFLITILVYSFLGRPALWLRISERIILLPLIAGFSYEIMKLADRHRNSRAVRIIAWPGLVLQRLTTRRPQEDQAEVALFALSSLIKVEGIIHDTERGIYKRSNES